MFTPFRNNNLSQSTRRRFLTGLTLGIETSCDDTAASVVEDGRRVLSNIVSSSVDFHAKYGGVIPEIASRFHVESIVQVTQAALSRAEKDISDIDLIAVTTEPGLISSLLVGISFAKALSFGLDIPLIAIDHIKAHLWAVFLEREVKLPAIGLIVSGGHTSLMFMKDINNFINLGNTRDDAVGETFDKVARILGLGYPGGPLIDRLAKKGNPRRFKFACAGLPESFEFSFSGIKTAVLYLVQSLSADKRDHRLICDIAASFQKSVVDVLVKKTLAASRLKKIKQVFVGGGVAANSSLRNRLVLEAQARGISVYFPKINLCLDNAAMVAGLGYQLYKRRHRN